jgi:hypothetical protein
MIKNIQSKTVNGPVKVYCKSIAMKSYKLRKKEFTTPAHQPGD